MPLRHREQDLRTQYWGSYTSTIGPTTFYEDKTDGFRRVCDDFESSNHSSPNDFQLLEVFTYYPILSATSPNGCIWNQIPIQTKFGGWEPRNVGFAALTGLDRSNMAWEILSKCNPSTPHVSVPTSLGELKDLPGLVRGYGRNLLKNAANGYLSWRWAVRPMISDLRKLCNFVKAVDDRTTMLMKLRAGETLRKRCSLGVTSGNIDSPASYIMESRLGGGLGAVAHSAKSSQAWGSCSWNLLPDSVLPTLGFSELKNFAKRLNFGFTSHEALATAWELCPWSWLADWFGNTGKLIAATNNSVGCTWSNICYMRTSQTQVVIDSWNGDPWLLAAIAGQQYTVRWTRKERYVVSPSVPFPFPQLPLLTGGQWSILAALAAQRLH